MPAEPAIKRAIAFFDGQNLFYNACDAFGYNYPNYDPKALATQIARDEDWTLTEIRFYTGMPDRVRDPFWHHFWSAKLAKMGRQGIRTFTRALKYRTDTVTLPDGTTETFTTKQEKGIDVRLSLDVVRFGAR